jgi:hypothetical protein
LQLPRPPTDPRAVVQEPGKSPLNQMICSYCVRCRPWNHCLHPEAPRQCRLSLSDPRRIPRHAAGRSAPQTTPTKTASHSQTREFLPHHGGAGPWTARNQVHLMTRRPAPYSPVRSPAPARS